MTSGVSCSVRAIGSVAGVSKHEPLREGLPKTLFLNSYDFWAQDISRRWSGYFNVKLEMGGRYFGFEDQPILWEGRLAGQSREWWRQVSGR